jgi:hypothetical protein
MTIIRNIRHALIRFIAGNMPVVMNVTITTKDGRPSLIVGSHGVVAGTVVL